MCCHAALGERQHPAGYLLNDWLQLELQADVCHDRATLSLTAAITGAFERAADLGEISFQDRPKTPREHRWLKGNQATGKKSLDLPNLATLQPGNLAQTQGPCSADGQTALHFRDLSFFSRAR
jgi:hypothetical protein